MGVGVDPALDETVDDNELSPNRFLAETQKLYNTPFSRFGTMNVGKNTVNVSIMILLGAPYFP
jgi:hypothetical protein